VKANNGCVDAALSRRDHSPSPLELEGWIEFTEAKWGVKAEQLRFTVGGKDVPVLDVVLYRGHRGRIQIPPRSPYTSLRFVPTPTELPSRLNNQWRTLSAQLADYCLGCPTDSVIVFPPDYADVREFVWKNFFVDVRYTYWLDLPVVYEKAESSVRKRIRKAVDQGFRTERVTNFEDVVACLAGTEDRKGFTHNLTAADLGDAARRIGEEHLRCYVCYTTDGKAASARVVLHSPGHRALGWLAGTKPEYLNSGVAQLNAAFVLDDLTHAKATGFDYCGANICSVAEAKSRWGGELVPYFVVKKPGYREVGRLALRWLKTSRNKRRSRNVKATDI
jgi:hypothetical protein